MRERERERERETDSGFPRICNNRNETIHFGLTSSPKYSLSLSLSLIPLQKLYFQSLVRIEEREKEREREREREREGGRFRIPPNLKIARNGRVECIYNNIYTPPFLPPSRQIPSHLRCHTRCFISCRQLTQISLRNISQKYTRARNVRVRLLSKETETDRESMHLRCTLLHVRTFVVVEKEGGERENEREREREREREDGFLLRGWKFGKLVSQSSRHPRSTAARQRRKTDKRPVINRRLTNIRTLLRLFLIATQPYIGPRFTEPIPFFLSFRSASV